MAKGKMYGKKLRFLDYECEIGERVQWLNIDKQINEGVLIDFDKNESIATVELDDGTVLNIKC